MIQKQLCEWSIKEEIGKTKHGNKIYRCVCKCGNERNFTLSYINAAKNFTKCKECKRKERDISDKTRFIGKIIGNWTVLKQLNDVQRGKRWLCQCVCGKKRTFSTCYINGNGKRLATTCMECYHKNQKDKKQYSYIVSEKTIKRIRRNAIKDCKEFTVTLEYLQKLFDKQNKKCKISGLPIHFTLLTGRNYYINTTASLDRIDSTKGYVEGNVQWVHKHINFMKWKFEEPYFIELCKTISQYNS